MKKSGLRPSLSPWSLLSRMLRLICLSFCFLLAGDPAVADTSAPSSRRGVYVPAPNVQVSDFRQRMLSEAQKAATGAHLRLQVSGEAPVDPSKAVVVDQKPGPNTMVPAGTTVTVVVRVPALRQTGPSRDIIVPERLTVVPELLKRSLAEAQPLVTSAEEYLRLREESWSLRSEALRKGSMAGLQGADRAQRAALAAFHRIRPAEAGRSCSSSCPRARR